MKKVLLVAVLLAMLFSITAPAVANAQTISWSKVKCMFRNGDGNDCGDIKTDG